jgi:ribosomal protein S7
MKNLQKKELYFQNKKSSNFKLFRLQNPIICKYIHYSLVKGKKNQSRSILIQKLEHLNKLTYDNTLFLAISNSSPALGLTSKRVGRFLIKKPFILKGLNRKFLGLKLLLKFVKKKKENKWILVFLHNLIEISKRQGISLKKQKEYHLSVLQNKSLIYL